MSHQRGRTTQHPATAIAGVLLAALAVVLATTAGTPVTAAAPTGATPSADVWQPRTVLLGRSVQGRGFYAYQVGDPQASETMVILGQMHGDEHAGVDITQAIRHGAQVQGINLWVVPTINPDGNAGHVRRNAHGVDLNRNWSWSWKSSGRSSAYYSGPKPFSEPETRELAAFLRYVKPHWVVSLHQPLYGVDSNGVKSLTLYRHLIDELGLPAKPLRCEGVCHGTMTGWFNHTQSGAGITVELARTPSQSFLQRAPTALVTALLGHY
ncbi:M14 family zinc carboxypeptidase [Nocardioides marmorisolisilvae]|uniref:M14 family zinc carboxypeptidase n=1 Tax=Nocardioides marmorisolisilvae TaxID=1542737 RepID=UPI00161EFC6D|nr:M14 family zinc carboxypeptidase [Nocardioides marmorisolisilvae]